MYRIYDNKMIGIKANTSRVKQ